MEQIINLIGNVGFPIACVLGLGYFIFKIYTDSQKESAKNLEMLQERGKEREDKLYTELVEGRIINGKFAEILSTYGKNIDDIRHDVSDIKTDIIEVKTKIEK